MSKEDDSEDSQTEDISPTKAEDDSVDPKNEDITPTKAPEADTNLYGLIQLVLNNSQLNSDEKKVLINEVRKVSPASDRWTFRWAIWILGATVILAVVALWVLSYYDHKIPEGLVAIGSGAAGGLAGLLTPGREKDNAGQ